MNGACMIPPGDRHPVRHAPNTGTATGNPRTEKASPRAASSSQNESRVSFPDSRGGEAGESGDAPDKGLRPLVLPYIDQPISFWRDLRQLLGDRVAEVYCPFPGNVFGSGRPPQAEAHLADFLREGPFPATVLVNALTADGPVESYARRVARDMVRLHRETGVSRATLAHPTVAWALRDALPDMRLCASVLLDVGAPFEVLMLEGLFDALVVSGRAVRSLARLRAVRQAFGGTLRLLVNEGCLPGCPYRVQHFHEMAHGSHVPAAPCAGLLARYPWMRLSGAWVLPQHLGLLGGLADEYKLAGRVTLADPANYRRVAAAYAYGTRLTPDAIGAGPSAPRRPVEVPEDYFAHTLACERNCHACTVCRDQWARSTRGL